VTEGTTLQRNSAAGYAAAAIITAAAIGVRLAFFDVFRGVPFITVFPAVVLATYLAGPGPGLLALMLGGVGAWYFLVPEFHTFAPKAPSDVIGVGVYGAVSAFMVWVLSALDRSIAREHEGRMRLAAAIEEKDALLRERELLLTEVRHRVGNNLQQITGLLMLHARRIGDPVAQEAFENATERVNLFAEVHQELYRTGRDKVHLDAVLPRLVTQLVAAHRPVGIACRVDVAPEFVWGPDKAVPIAMVVHELVCNALEHGFGDDETGTIAVALGRTDTGLVRLTVADDGRGLPPGSDAAHVHSLGLSIIRAFARQLNATFGLHPAPDGRGTVGEFLFDDRPGRPHGQRRADPKKAAA
jgi:two-component system, sensor histidine kinase PdtaS